MEKMTERAKPKDGSRHIVIVDGEEKVFTKLGGDFQLQEEKVSLVLEDFKLDDKVGNKYKDMLRVADEEEKVLKNGHDSLSA